MVEVLTLGATPAVQSAHPNHTARAISVKPVSVTDHSWESSQRNRFGAIVVSPRIDLPVFCFYGELRDTSASYLTVSAIWFRTYPRRSAYKRKRRLGPAERLTLILGPRKAGADTFLYHGAFEFGEHAHHLKHCLAGGRRGVDRLLVKVQVDLEGVDFSQELD
jgi:hypothetical protein